MFARTVSVHLKKLVIASALLAFAVTSFAETTAVKVPFNFVADGKQCSSGLYSVILDAQFNTVKLQSADGVSSFQWVALSGSPSPNDTRVILTFDQAKSGYALRTVQYHNKITGKLDKNIPESLPTRTIVGQ
jgi:hypothetical protein